LTLVDAEQFPGLMQGEMGALARKQVQDADMIVLNKVDLVDAKELAAVKLQLEKLVPRLRIFDASHGRVPLDLVMGSGIQSIGSVRDATASRGRTGHLHDHPFSTWHWTSDRPLSLPGLRSVVEALPDSVYRLKGIVYLEEFPSHQVVLQMVGRRYCIGDTEPWGSQRPQSEIVLIASRGGFNSEALQRAFDGCIGTGDESQSPILRLNRFLATSAAENQ